MFLKLSKFFLYAAVCSVLVVMPSIFFPFIGGKYFFFRTMVALSSVAVLLYWAFADKTKEMEKRFFDVSGRPLFLAVSVFALVYLLAAVFADNPHAAFWSNFERGEGAFQMIHYYVFFFLLALLVRTEREWKQVLSLAVVAAVGVILYGIFAQAGWVQSFIGPVRDFGISLWDRLTGPRFQGSLGNPAYVAPYLMFAMFFALFLWARRRGKARRGIVYGALAGFFLVFFVLSQTRGAFLGLLAALVAGLLYLFFSWREGRKWIGGIFLALIVLGGVLTAFRDAPLIERLPGARFFEIADLGIGDRTVQTRFWTWNSAWQGVTERPILGWGPENFSTVFDKYFDPRHFIPGTNAETWFDRAHSVVFDYMAETGIVGFLAYLAVFGVFYYQFFRHYVTANRAVRGKGESSLFALRAGEALIFAMPIGYLVQGLALFDVLPIYLNLFLFFGLALFLFPWPQRRLHSSNGMIGKPYIAQSLAIAAGLAALWSIYYGSYLPMRKGQLFIGALQSQGAETVEAFVAGFAPALAFPSPVGQEEIVRNTGNHVVGLIQRTDSPEAARKLMEFAESNFAQILASGKGMSFTQNYFLLGNMHRSALPLTQDRADLEAAKRYYLEGLKLSPTRPQFLYGLFDAFILDRDKENARAFGEKILQYWPTDDRVAELFQGTFGEQLTDDE
ncbi:MAG: O-antigen ligase family protein [Candidatus Liptonbacteria bacterium]|nr:O-antigen ligase family protein [Candidatus Liptonbacteria bacterium]